MSIKKYVASIVLNIKMNGFDDDLVNMKSTPYKT